MTPKHISKPVRARYTVAHMGKRGYVVLDPSGTPVSGGTAFIIQASGECRDLQRAADLKGKVGQRACLCCQREFPSEGMHNRLCNGCSRKDAGADPVRPYVQRRRPG